LAGVLARMFVPENLERVEDFARAYAPHVGELTMRVLCEEPKDLLEEDDVNG